jgi:AcrR family transcriptional regulator
VEAYIALSGERPSGSLSVVEIAERAGLNRATFYRHFESVGDLRDRGLPLFFAELAQGFPGDELGMEPGWKEAAEARVSKLFEIVLSRHDLFLPFAAQNPGSEAWTQALLFLEAFLRDERLGAATSRLRVPASLAARSIASLLAGMVTWALEHPSESRPRELARHYVDILDGGFLVQPLA